MLGTNSIRKGKCLIQFWKHYTNWMISANINEQYKRMPLLVIFCKTRRYKIIFEGIE